MGIQCFMLMVGMTGSLGGEPGGREQGVGVETLTRIEAQLQEDAARINNLEKKNEKLVRIIEELKETQDTKGEDRDRSTKIDKDIIERVEDLERDTIRIDGELASLETKTKKLAVCGSADVKIPEGIITYNQIVAEVNELGGQPLDISSGKFTAPVTGVYEVSAAVEYCGNSGDGSHQHVDLYMNDNYLERIMYQEKYDSGYMQTPCSGFRYVELNEGDNLYLRYYRTISSGYYAEIDGLKFCISLYSTTE